MDTLQLTLLSKIENQYSKRNVKPFLKWAGGKGQLLEQMSRYFPEQFGISNIKRYVEPFIGGGAIFFYIAQVSYIQEFFISDVNEELILVYQTIQRDVEGLIDHLTKFQQQYFQLDVEQQKELFYRVRSEFNVSRSTINFFKYHPEWTLRAAQLIFLNRTCYNGLFRVNSKSEFNVPFGRYKNPRICDKENLRATSQVLQGVEIYSGDFFECQSFVDADTFVYFDPPYRPISKTASFTSYSSYDFDDEAQKRLAQLFRELDKKGAKLMLSNSDPKNENLNDDFFDKLYEGFRINRVMAARMINCDATKRGPINELVITNY